MLTFQQIVLALNQYWDRQGCVLLQPYDMILKEVKTTGFE